MKEITKEQELILKKLGARIATIRKSKNISQTDLGYLCNMEKPNISRIELGKTNPTFLTIFVICKSLDISISEILSTID